MTTGTKKRGITSIDTEIDQPKYPGIKLVPGLKVCGVPVGSDEYVKSALRTFAVGEVKEVHEAITTLPFVQQGNLLHTNYGGTSRVQHLW